jgi:hypothetical protein
MKSLLSLTLVVLVSMVMVSGVSYGACDPSTLYTPGDKLNCILEIVTELQNANNALPLWSQTLPASTRFELVLGGVAVLDKETGLVWEQSPSEKKEQWFVALNKCFGLTKGNRLGWRLPTIEELSSLIDPTQSNPALPSGYPFGNVHYGVDEAYFSITNFPMQNFDVYVRTFNSAVPGLVAVGKTTTELFYWCVRGGHGVDPSPLNE